jgi:hypothetical protein
MRVLCGQIVLVSSLLVAGVALADAPAMQSFASSDGRFSVQFPGSPKQEKEAIPLQGSDTSTLFEFYVELEDNNVSYMVMYNDYPEGYATGAPQDVLANVRDGSVKNKTMTSDAEISLNGVPGRAFTATDSKGWSYSVHQFLSGKRLYQLIVVSNKDHPAPLTEQFMNSFRIQ